MKPYSYFINESQATQEDLEKVNVFVDADSSKWDSTVQSVKSYMTSRGYSDKRLAGVALTKAMWKGGKLSDMVLYEPDSFDAGLLKTNGVKVKNGEVVLRMATKNMAAGGIMSFLKVNFIKGMAYFMAENDDQDDESIRFETKGEKFQYARFTSAFMKKHVKVV